MRLEPLRGIVTLVQISNTIKQILKRNLGIMLNILLRLKDSWANQFVVTVE